MKLYKIAAAPAGERFHSSKTGLKEPIEIELPKDGRAAMAAFLNGNELEIGGADVQAVPAEPLDELEAAELRAVAQAATPTTVPNHEQRNWDATDIEDFILNRATVDQASNIFACLGTRFKEFVNERG